jgi:hypothetical protein
MDLAPCYPSVPSNSEVAPDLTRPLLCGSLSTNPAVMLAVIKPRINLSAFFPFGFLRIHHDARRIDLFLGYFTGLDKIPAHTAARGAPNDNNNNNNNSKDNP